MRVTEIRPDAEDAVILSLAAGNDLKHEYRGLPGQHVVLRTQIGGVERRRTYSPITPPGQWPLQIAVRVHRDGVVSKHLATQLSVGDQIDVLPPNGSLTPRFHDRRTYIGFASGCGITPVLSIARAVLAGGRGSRFILFYGNTNTARTMCLEEVQALKDRYVDRFAVHFVMSREPQEAELYNGRLDALRVKRLAQILFEPAAVAEYFVCGPGSMIEEVSTALKDCGVEAERIHGEHFNVEAEAGASLEPGEPPVAKPAAASVAPATGPAATDSARATKPAAPAATDAARATKPAAPAATDTARATKPAAPPATDTAQATKPAAPDIAEVTVTMDGRKRSFTMRMCSESVLDAAARSGIELPFSCRAGVCSTCRTKVVRGEVEMVQNYALEEWELADGYVLACQSRVISPVLELDYDEK